MIDEQVELIRAQVGDERVICGLSGGVDCAVAALLVYRAVGDQLTCVFVDHGLMREGEGEQVVRDVPRPLRRPARARRCARAIPRATRRGRRSGDQAQAHRRGVHPRLRGGGAQPRRRRASSCRARSTRTSSSRARARAAKIKSHHNVGGLPEDMDLELVEPLRALFKDEVRRSASSSGCPMRSSGASRSPAGAGRSASSAR